MCRGVKNDDFSMFGDLDGDFCQATYEPNMFGMHIGSVLSGLGMGNVNTDIKMLNSPAFWVKLGEFGGSKMTVFLMFGGLGGDFYKDTYELSFLGCIVEMFCVVGIQKMQIPTLICRFYLCVGWGTCMYTGSTGSFFGCLEALEGTFVRTHMRQSCLGCILEVF